MIYMVSTVGRGGIRSVVESLRAQGFFDGRDIRWLASHDEGSVPHRLLLALRAGLVILWACLRGRVTLLHLHSAMRGSFWRKAIYLVIARSFGVPVVFHVHGSQMEAFHAALGRVGRALFAATLRHAQVVVVLSASWRDFIVAAAPGARVEIVANAVPIPLTAAAVDDPSGVLRLTFLGLVGQRKGIFDLVEALATLPTELQARLRLNIGGNGELERLRERVRSAGCVADIRILGWIDATAREELLAQTDIFVLPSYNEGLPMALLEAMARGLPVISTFAGGIPELVRNEEHGLLVAAGDKVALADAVSRLALAPALRSRMGAAARRRVQTQFSPAATLARLNDVYRQALE